MLRDYAKEVCHEFSIIVSTAQEPTPTTPAIPNSAIIVNKNSATQRTLAQQVQKQLELLGSATQGIISLEEAISSGVLTKAVGIFLLEVDKPLFPSLNQENFAALHSALISTQSLIWVTGNNRKIPEFGIVDGLGRALCSENSELVFTTLSLEDPVTSPNRHTEYIVDIFERTLTSIPDDCESGYVERDGMLHISRLVEAAYLNHGVHMKSIPQQAEVQEFGAGPPLRLTVASPGLLDSLQFLEDKDVDFTKPLGLDDVEIEVKAAGVNFVDCLVALGRINQSTMGAECAGVVKRAGEASGFHAGDHVAASTSDTMKTIVRVPSLCCVKIPENMSFTEAAALPTNFVTAWYSLEEIARIRKGETILIHSGSGGTGQAAIQVARHFGAQVFTTVGSEEKKKLLMDLYDIPENHILYSRDNSFAKGIKRLTGGRGVDVILNSLAGELLVASWECIAPFGRFIEIGKKDIWGHGKLPMFPFAKNVGFSAVDIASMPAEKFPLIQRALKSVVDLVAAGKMHSALPLQVYGVSEVERSFRSMQSGKNTGKMVIQMNNEEAVLVSEF